MRQSAKRAILKSQSPRKQHVVRQTGRKIRLPHFSVQALTAKLVAYLSEDPSAGTRPRWYWSTGTSDLPVLKSRVVILRHKLPTELVSVNDFIKQHRIRYIVQRNLALGRGISTNPLLTSIQAVALPVFAGFDATRNEFVTVLPYQTGGKPLPKRLGHIEYAALERSLCKVWSAGYQFASLDTARMSMSSISASNKVQVMEVMIYDCSQLVGRVQWLANQFRTVIPGRTSIRFETMYAPGGDATALNALYEQLPPPLKPNERDALVDAARKQLWGVANATRNKNF